MQGWLFVFHGSFWRPDAITAYLSKVPENKMILLDLISEATPAYESTNFYDGRPFIWNLLHNFGGNIGMRGNFDTIMNRPYEAKNLRGSTMQGVGLTMEGINQNTIIYELLLDHVWEPEARSTDAWLKNWVHARYGMDNDKLFQAWSQVVHSVYDVKDPAQGNGFWGVTKSIIVKRPSVQKNAVIRDGFQMTLTRYDSCSLVNGWKMLLSNLELNPDLKNKETFRYDLVDWTRQILANYASVIYSNMIDAYENKEEQKLDHESDKLLNLMDELDSLLGTHKSFYLVYGNIMLNSLQQMKTNQNCTNLMLEI
eukprot:UN27406